MSTQGGRAVERMRVQGLDAFDAFRAQWDRLFVADPSSHVFLSSAWLRAFLPNAPHRWSILALREGDELIAALPISLRGAPHHKLPIAHELTFASVPFADYQGMLCRLGREDDAVDAFAAMLNALSWERASFPDTADPRIGALVAKLGGAARSVEGSPCSAIDLPAEWPDFLARLSKPTRRGLVQPLKTIEEKLPAARFSSSTEPGADAGVHIDAMLRVNQLRWGGNQTRKERYTRILRAAHEQGCLRVTILWDGERPIAGATMFRDEAHGVIALYLVGHDPEYARASPGKALLAAVIRDAIGGGSRVLDLLRGDDSYKSSFVNRTSTNTDYTVARRGARALLYRTLEPAFASLRAALTRLRPRPAA
jgi:CelD/BcsL family acetyltransferase involved in cellulose biosynthesis